MKPNMKKILFPILAAAAMSASCTQFEEDTVPAYDSVAKPQVSATVLSDTEINVTVAAGENTNWYGYAVVEGAIDASADKLVAGGYSKDAAVVLQGESKEPQAASIKYSDDTKTVSLSLVGLVPYTEYTVYAAAVSPMGVTSEVVSVTVRTTDGTEPVAAIDAADYSQVDEQLVFVIPFSDPVSLTDAGSAKAYFYAENYMDENSYFVVYKEVDIPADHISADNNNLILAIPQSEYIPGAMVSVTWSAGIVKNAAGAENVAFEDHLMAFQKNQVVWNGVVGSYDYVNWDFSLVDPATLPDEPAEGGIEDGEDEEEEVKVPVYFSDWETLAMNNYTMSDYPLAGRTSGAKVTVKAVEMSGKTITYDTKSFGVSDGLAVVMLDEAPSFGSSISYTIAEGSFVDLFGNENNEFVAEDEYYRSYGYSIDDVLGTYNASGINLWSRATVSYPMVVALSDNAASGNVMITNYLGIEGKLYCYFDIHAGTLFVYEGDIFAEGYATWFNSSGDQNFIYSPGQITSDAMVMIVTVADNSITGYATDADGNYIGISPMVATKVE